MNSEAGSALSPLELIRYGRHLSLEGVGLVGQERLKAAKVLCVGVGGLGSPAALYLAAAGIGTLGLVDFDVVELSNLQRQVLYSVEDVGSPKTEAARRRLLGLNPGIRVVAHQVELSIENVQGVVEPYDVVIDGSDNFATRYLVNDACVALGKPEVWASIFRFEGQLSVFDARMGPCYRCLFPAPPAADQAPSCAEAGVLGVLPGILGVLQASEALKIVLRTGTPSLGRLLLFDALGGAFDEVAISKDPACPTCSGGLSKARVDSALWDPGLPDQAVADQGSALTCEALASRLAAERPPLLVDCREAFEWEICRLEGSSLMPMRALPGRLAELPMQSEIVVVCHHGPRSEAVAEFLVAKGFPRVRWLEGGLDAWARRIDVTMARY